MDQSQTPLVSALQQCADRENAAFHTPGHKRGQGISAQQQALFGEKVFRADLPELPDLDNLFAPEGVILQAQQLAAQAFGAEQTWFLANGSTCGIEAAILATCRPGTKLILPRNVHSSAISGLILSGAVPVYVQPDYSEKWDMPLGIQPSAIEAALKANPDAQAVLVVSPTYYGICSELAAIAQLAHRYHCPLIVDEAHAPHFSFHPDLPQSALVAGADIAIQSAHKVLSAFTQSALLHVQGERINRHKITQALQLTQSTSPSYLLLGSLDAARQQMATAGMALMTKTLGMADRAYQGLSELSGLRVLQPGREEGQGEKGKRKEEERRGKKRSGEERGICRNRGDRTRLTVDVTGLGLTGFQADEILHEQMGVTAELPSLRHLMFLITLGNTSADITHLIQSFQKLCQQHPPISHSGLSTFKAQLPIFASASWRVDSTAAHTSSDPQVPTPLSPRQAFFSPTAPLPIAQALGHLCAETLCPYPPGIPVLRPGEPITLTAITYLQTIQAAGGLITGCRDPSLKTILVIQE